MLRVGLNPYGLTYTVGLQGAGTVRANPDAVGLEGFIEIARAVGARCLEMDDAWLIPMSQAALTALARRLDDLGMIPICSHGLTHIAGETLDDSIRCASALGGALLRLHVTPVLEGARAARGSRWSDLLDHARRTVIAEARKAAAHGIALAIENHQDLGSHELLALAVEAGDHVGIALDTGNAFAVGEDPVAFTRRVASRVRHVHLKDYRAQFTDEGFWLVRCAIGDGCVPFGEITRVLAGHHASLTASIEPGALEARHIRVFTPDWWQGYVPVAADEFGTAMGRLRFNRLAETADRRTPWETGAPASELIAYEREHLQRSVAYWTRQGQRAKGRGQRAEVKGKGKR